MNENTESAPARSSKRAKSPSAAPREVVMGLDRFEKIVSYFAGYITLVLAGVEFITSKHTHTLLSYKLGKAMACKTGYKLFHLYCEKSVLASPSAARINAAVLTGLGLTLLYFVLRKKRAGVIFVCVFLFLVLGVNAGALFLFVGGWLMIRAFRLQKYGDASFSGSGKKAREVAAQRRAERANGTAAAPAARAISPKESKRYTPKQRPRGK